MNNCILVHYLIPCLSKACWFYYIYKVEEEANNDGAQGQRPITEDRVKGSEDSMGFISWSQLLNGPPCDDILTRDLF